MAYNVRYSNGNARRKAVARLKAEGRGCWICRAFGRNDTIDYSLPARHPFAFECDEKIPVSNGRTPAEQKYLATHYPNLDATHRCCNEWRGNKSVDEVLRLASMQKAAKNKPKKLEQPIDF